MLVCKHCGKEVEESKIRKAHIKNDLEDVCEDCLEEFFAQCADCEEYFLKEDLHENVDGELICESCIEENYAYCGECNCLERIDNMRWAEDEQCYICESCFDDYFEQCDDCGNIYRRDNMQYIEYACGYYVCENCLDNYGYCENCGEWHHIDNLHYDEYSEEYYCDSCWEDREVEGILDYHGNNGDWTKYKLSEENEDILYIGHETEIEPKNSYGYDIREAVNAANTHLNCWLEHDGSLNDGGFEIVSQPQSYKYMLEHYENYKQAFQKIIEAGYVSHDSNNCGLHFHFTAPYERDTEERDTIIARLWLIIETYKDEFEKMSRRAGNFRWCEFLSKSNDNTIVDGIYRMTKARNKGDRYLVINNNNNKTIELRLFKGTLNVDTFYADMQFAHNLFTLAYDLSLDITEITWAKLVEGEFISKYCEEHNIYSDKKITDNSLKYITLENKTMRLIKNIYNEYDKGIKLYTKNVNLATKEFNYDYLEKIDNIAENIRYSVRTLMGLRGYINKKDIQSCIYMLRDLFNNRIELQIDKAKIDKKYNKIVEYNNSL